MTWEVELFYWIGYVVVISIMLALIAISLAIAAIVTHWAIGFCVEKRNDSLLHMRDYIQRSRYFRILKRLEEMDENPK